MKNIFLLLGVMIFVNLTVSAQDYIPKIIPPSPEATALAKFGDVPVNLYNGLPEINIPLFEIKVRDLSFPLSISYHASGIKVEEEADWVGLGWALNAAGVITRTVNGNDDFLYSANHNYRGYLYSYDFTPDDQSPEKINAYLREQCLGTLDLKPDIFYFNFHGHSGKFYLQRKNTPSDPVTAVLLSAEKMKIDYDETTGIWTLITIDGSRYLFSEKEFTENWTGSGDTWQSANLTLPSPEPCNEKFISAWYLTKIISARGDTVLFSYKHAAENGNEYVSRSMVRVSESITQCLGFGKLIARNGCLAESSYENYGFVPMNPGYNSPIDLGCLFDFITDWKYRDSGMSGYSTTFQGCDFSSSYSASSQIHHLVYLKRIDYPGGHVDFFTGDRQDMSEQKNDVRYPGIIYSKPQFLERIEVFNSRNKLQNIEFKYSYFNDGRNDDPVRFKRLKLNSVQVKNYNEAVPPYIFSYAEDVDLPAKDSGSRDHWGYCNNSDNQNNTGRQGTIPGLLVISGEGMIQEIPGASREPVENFTKAAVLVKIVYPTGGYTVFEYENHTFNIDQETHGTPYKQWTLSSQNKNTVFELKYAAEVTFNVELKCGTVSCYPNGTEIPCEIPAANESYFILESLDNNQQITKELYADFMCTSDPANAWCQAHSISQSGAGVLPCGITRRIALNLRPGRYLVRNNPLNDIDVNLIINFLQPETIVEQNDHRIIHGGGLRIKSITTHDGLDESNNLMKEFKYDFPDSAGLIRSSGKLMTFPKYAFGEYYIIPEQDGYENMLINLKAASYSNVPMGSSAQSSPVGYDKVVEIFGQNGSGGYTEYYFTNEPDEELAPFFPNSSTNSHAAGNGLLVRQVDRNSNHFKVREILNEYDSKYLSMIRGFDVIAFSCGSPEMFLYDNFDFVFRNYILPSSWWFKISSEERTYDIADHSNQIYLSQKSDWLYNPDHKQIIRTDMINSEGQRLTNHYYYALDARENSPDEMWDEKNQNYRHMHNYLIEEESLIHDGAAARRIIKKTNQYIYNPHTGQVLLDNIQLGTNGAEPEIKIRFSKYDSKSNILEYIKYGTGNSDEIITTVLWGYHQLLPVAFIENASYDEVINASEKCGITITTLAGKNDELSIRNDLLRIQKELPEARMSIYTYEESVGTTSITDPNGKTTYYKYDDLRRVKTILDFEMNKIRDYQYHYQTKTQTE